VQVLILFAGKCLWCGGKLSGREKCRGGYVRGVKCPSPSLVAGAAFSDRRPLLLAVSGFARHRDADSVRLIRTNLIDDNAVLSSA